MGTENPNPNAVLELVSEKMDQGFLVPRFTTSQRTASGFTRKLTNTDNGLLVFDIDEGKFFYWYNGEWRQGAGTGAVGGTGTVWYTGSNTPGDDEGNNGDFYIQTISGDVYRKQNGTFDVIGNILPQKSQYMAGKGISIGADNSIANTGDLDASNEIQDLQLNNDQLTITNNTAATSIDLSPYLDNTDTQTLSLVSTNLSISGGNTVNLAGLQDGTGTDDQNLGSSKTGNNVTLTIEDGSGTTFSVADDDSSTLNEIQDLSLISHQLSITSNASATPIDLSPYLDNTDSQSLSFLGTNLTISGGNTVNLSGLQDGTGTDDQNLTSGKIGNNVTINIEDGTGTTFSVADDDSSISNETITSVSLTGETLRIREAGVNHDVDLSSLGGVALIGDPSSSNELITSASLIGNTLRIIEDGTNHDVNLSTFQRTTLSDGKVLVGNALNIAAPVAISGDVTLNNDGTMTITLDAITTAKIINDAVDKDKIHANVAGAGLGQNADGSLEINATGGLQITADQLSLANTGNGQVLIGNGSTVNAQTIGGDATLANDGTVSVVGLQGRPVGSAAPASGNVLTWNGTNWIPQAPSGGGSGAAWYEGVAVPIVSNPAGAVDGDYYYKTDTDIIYRKEGGAWIEQGKWVKQPEITLNDKDGNPITITDISTPTIYRGSGEPKKENPNIKPGDFYYDISNDKLYLRKNDHDWQGY